jgi:uncharacterized membrane protein YbaN (DUF454 family)
MLHRAWILAWLAWDTSSFFEWLAKRPWYTQFLIEWADGRQIPVNWTSLPMKVSLNCIRTESSN